MFEKWETYSYPNTDAKALHTYAFQWWPAAGFRVTETAPGQFNAVSKSCLLYTSPSPRDRS